MCGIAGIFGYHVSAPPVDARELERLREAMAVRGPDGAGSWISGDGRIGLAHRRLSILDLSAAGAQPMSTEDLRYWITFNGEIYNHSELRAELEGKGHRFRSQSDTETLLHLYREYGPGMVPKLRGMFAFALWDVQAQRLFLARDPFGIKPLYIADDGRTFRFASQVKALRLAEGVDLSLDPAGQVGFCLLGHIPDPHTLYRGIRALPAGSTLEVHLSGPHRPRTFFDVTEALAQGESEAEELAEEAMQERLALLVRESVTAHQLADVPVGVFLSSGIDSCTLARIASGQPDPLRTVTLGFTEYRGTSQDETPLAEAMAEQLGSTHRTRWVTKEDFQAHLEQALTAMDQPSIDGLNTYFVSQATATTGLKVALSGLGGDELFGGYSSFQQVPRLPRMLGPLSAAPALGRAFRRAWIPTLGRLAPPKYASLFELGPTLAGAYLLRRGLFMPWELPALLGDTIAREGWESLALIERLEGTVKGLNTDRTRICALETAWYMRNQLLRDSDWAGMAHGLEIRVPLVDVALFCAIAPFQALSKPPTKTQLGRTPHLPLPDHILHRPKTGFSIPIRQWAMSSLDLESKEAGLRGWARHMLARALPELEPA